MQGDWTQTYACEVGSLHAPLPPAPHRGSEGLPFTGVSPITLYTVYRIKNQPSGRGMTREPGEPGGGWGGSQPA